MKELLQRWSRPAFLAAALLSMLWGFQAMLLQHAPGVFMAIEEDMSYAWFVPLFSLYVVWVERRELLASLGAPSWGGFALMLAMLPIGFLGARGIQVRFEIVAFAGLLVALPWAFYGRRTAARVLFPAAFLLFCIPLNSYLDIVTVHLRIFASSTAYALLKGFGADVVRHGTMVGAADGSFLIDIAEPCSGLRSIFALTALTAGYAYFNQRTWLKRAVLFAASVPLAIAGNVARILTICLVANFADKDFAMGFYHDYSGYVVFVVAILLMIAFGELLQRLPPCGGCAKPVSVPDAGPASAPAAAAASASDRVIPPLALAVMCAAMAFQAATPETTVTEPPRIELAEIAGFEYQDVEPSEGELTILPKDTRFLKRVYFAPNGDWFQVTAVIGGTSKSSIHRPELCLPSQGYLMRNPHNISAGGVDWRFIRIDMNTGGSIGFAYTFFNQAGMRTCSHMKRILRDVWDRSVFNRIDRWVMVTINASRPDEQSLRRFIEKLELFK